MRLEQKKHGADASLEPLTREYQEAANAYIERWGNVRRKVNARWEAVEFIAKGVGKRRKEGKRRDVREEEERQGA